MAALSVLTNEPGLTTASPSAGVVFAANPTQQQQQQPPPPPQPTDTSSNGAMQSQTILGIVIGLVCFVVVILGFCFISRFPWFRPSKSVPPISPPPRSQPWTRIDAPNQDNRLSSFNAGRDHHDHNIHGSRPRPRVLVPHVELTVFTFTEHRTQYPYLPPYGGPSPPAYPDELQHPPQYPARAVVEP